MIWSMSSHMMYIFNDKSRKILTVCSECLKLKFMTANIYRNYLTYKIVGVFYVYLYNAPIFAQSSLRQGTI